VRNYEWLLDDMSDYAQQIAFKAKTSIPPLTLTLTLFPDFDFFAEVPRYIIGHSMGGGLAFALKVKQFTSFDAVLGFSPAVALHVSPKLRTASPFHQYEFHSPPIFVIAPGVRSLLQLIGSYAPRLPLIKLASDEVSRNAEAVSVYVNDPLVFHGSIPANTLGEFSRVRFLFLFYINLVFTLCLFLVRLANSSTTI